jgi:hypothetical protein
MRAVWAIGLLASCNGGGGGGGSSIECGAGTALANGVCLPTIQTCGGGTHEDNGACLPDASYEIRALPQLRADGYSASEVRVVGTNPDGTPSHELVIVTSSRADAGAFASPTFVLGDRGGAANFVPCNATTPGCVGPTTLSVELSSAPLTLLASVTVDLVAPPQIASLAPCTGMGNILYFDAQNFGMTGTVSITTDGVFDVFGGPDRARVQVVANSVGRSLEMNTQKLGIPLLTSVYENAQLIGYAEPGAATFELSDYVCSPVSAFQVHEFTYNASIQDVTLITATFEQHCSTDPTRRRTGCVHYSQ